MTIAYESWGKLPQAEHVIQRLRWRTEDIKPEWIHGSILPFGLGRSYGDSCLNDGGTLLDTSSLNHFIRFDPQNGIFACEAGVTFADILKIVVPRGWFLPVTPGTKYVTVGGAVANDVHGKNHHRAGTFGCHVTRFELLRSDGKRLVCSKDENHDWFRATIGGLGLTGLILWAEFKLKKIQGPFIDGEFLKFSNLEEFFEISADSDESHEYTVGWLDCLSKGKNFGRGIFIRGSHSDNQSAHTRGKDQLLNIPFDLPDCLLNRFSIKLFNTFYFNKQPKKKVKKQVSYEPFFYPLDAIGHWNRIYGKRGFFQYQCVIPEETNHPAVKEILKLITESGRASFLTVLKNFGAIHSPGMLSFPRKGLTLAFDFPNQGVSSLKLFNELDKIVITHGGALYPAKDARMSPESFQTFFPQWKEFSRFLDPKFSSSFWRRVTKRHGEESKYA
ncbi:MAG: FAD-binding oxidoreductase [Candidatus Omnitrophica bacterium]|nr:FAD-binding oxidoreductase [Candidatus Omnitrophota bacterium]